MKGEFVHTIAFERVLTPILPDVGPVAAVLTQFKRVDVRRCAVF